MKKVLQPTMLQLRSDHIPRQSMQTNLYSFPATSNRPGYRRVCRRRHRSTDQAVLNQHQKHSRSDGLSMANVVKTTVLLKNISDFGAMNEVYATFFEGACRQEQLSRLQRSRREHW